jgi:hypothetical protein
MNDFIDYISSPNIVINKTDKAIMLNSSQKCPFMKIGPIIPLANKYYGYCTISNGKGDKRAIGIEHIHEYCCSFEEEVAFMQCQIWQESPFRPPT